MVCIFQRTHIHSLHVPYAGKLYSTIYIYIYIVSVIITITFIAGTSTISSSQGQPSPTGMLIMYNRNINDKFFTFYITNFSSYFPSSCYHYIIFVATGSAGDTDDDTGKTVLIVICSITGLILLIIIIIIKIITIKCKLLYATLMVKHVTPLFMLHHAMVASYLTLCLFRSYSFR